ncbi:hypothetical protein [Streptacidiphilus sp. EB129]|jgi:hypothetical protein|uniref:hypothetical protein n=1 Tax=Streptacidiphilus sp. EB129 TaxID=3156262 RepID=UPI003517A5EA
MPSDTVMTGESGFEARTGHEHGEVFDDTRQQQVLQAWKSLRQIRCLTLPEHPQLPAEWEKNRPLQAIGLALEAGGTAFCALDEHGAVQHTGVQLTLDSPTVVRVVWRHRRGERPSDAGDVALGRCVGVLAQAGWDALLYRAGRTRYVIVQPGLDG